MYSPNTPYIAIVTICAALNAILCLYAFIKRTDFSGIRFFIFITLATVIYSTGYAFELTAETLVDLKTWISIEYIAIPFLAPLSLMLILHYIGSEMFLTRITSPLLFVIPVITTILVATNDHHHFYYNSLTLRTDNPFPVAELTMGPGYILYWCHSVACLLLASVLLLRQLLRSKSSYHVQHITLLAGLIVPMIINLTYTLGMIPLGIDPIPFVMTITSALFIWSIYSKDLLNFVPIAKDIIFESIRDGVLVLNSADRLVDYNQSASRLLPALRDSFIGEPIEEIWYNMTGTRLTVVSHGEQEITWNNGDAEFDYLIRCSTVYKTNGREAGRMMMLIDITEQNQLHQQLLHMAYYDGLTDIFNRPYFLRRSRECLTQVIRRQHTLSIILFDIDFFKQINDTYGHEIGDQAIIHIITLCQQQLQKRDLLGRYGGEEFILCLPYMPLEQAGQLAEQIREQIVDHPFKTSTGEIKLSASFGVSALSSPLDTIESLLRNADQALYGSKNSGRNAVSLFHEGDIHPFTAFTAEVFM